jgi:hypothetical protein
LHGCSLTLEVIHQIAFNERKTTQSLGGRSLAPIANQAIAEVAERRSPFCQLVLQALATSQILCSRAFPRSASLSRIGGPSHRVRQPNVHLYHSAHAIQGLMVNVSLMREVAPEFGFALKHRRKPKRNYRNLMKNRLDNMMKC